MNSLMVPNKMEEIDVISVVNSVVKIVCTSFLEMVDSSLT